LFLPNLDNSLKYKRHVKQFCRCETIYLYQGAKMSKTRYETAIFQAAANIFASYIAAGQVTGENQAEMMKKAIAASISMAQYVEDVIISDNEMSGRTDRLASGKDLHRKR